MGNTKFITILFCLISGILNAQETASVEVFEGNGAFSESQVILDLSYKGLKRFPLEAANSEIEVLILDNNSIEKIPAWIGDLKNLKVLSIRNNNLFYFKYSKE